MYFVPGVLFVLSFVRVLLSSLHVTVLFQSQSQFGPVPVPVSVLLSRPSGSRQNNCQHRSRPASNVPPWFRISSAQSRSAQRSSAQRNSAQAQSSQLIAVAIASRPTSTLMFRFVSHCGSHYAVVCVFVSFHFVFPTRLI